MISCGTANDVPRNPGTETLFWKDAVASTECTMTIVIVQNEENHENRRRQFLSTLQSVRDLNKVYIISSFTSKKPVK
jgi:predicted transcriptional regulator